ncbi:nuclease-related domain-containing protein, partial [Clostridium neonatale]
MYLLIFLAVVMIFVYLVNRYEYHNSNYKDLTGNTYNEVMNDKSKYSEFLTVEELERLDVEHRISVNVYISQNDRETTEINVIYICHYGIFVIESKNYNGLIYG